MFSLTRISMPTLLSESMAHCPGSFTDALLLTLDLKIKQDSCRLGRGKLDEWLTGKDNKSRAPLL